MTVLWGFIKPPTKKKQPSNKLFNFTRSRLKTFKMTDMFDSNYANTDCCSNHMKPKNSDSVNFHVKRN